MIRLVPMLVFGIGLAVALAITLGETALSLSAYASALTNPSSDAAIILWQVRAPRAACAFMVGAALGLSGALLQGLLRNPLADPGVLGVSATAALGAAMAIVLGAAAIPGAVEGAALTGAGLAGLALTAVAARLASPEGLILFGVALSSLAGAVTALVFNLSPSPIATAEVMAWLLGSVQNRSWIDVGWVMPAVLASWGLARLGRRGLRLLTLGEEVASSSGVSLGQLRTLVVVSAAIATGAAVAVAGVIGFVGLAAPHLVRSLVRGDPGRLLGPSALAGGLMLIVADLMARLIPTDQELKLGVFTALVGAPLFALIAWRAAREWRS